MCDQCGITGRERSGGGGDQMMVGVRDTAGERGASQWRYLVIVATTTELTGQV